MRPPDKIIIEDPELLYGWLSDLWKYLELCFYSGVTTIVDLTNSEIKALRTSPKELVAVPGSGKLLEFVSAVLILDAGSEVLTESEDNLAIEYNNGSGVAVSETIEVTGFIDQPTDTITRAIPVKDAIDASADIVNKNLALVNIGDGEYGGNASNDAEMRVIITYRNHTSLDL